MTNMWMVRSEGGSLYEEFRDRNVVAIGWWRLAQYATTGTSRRELAERYRAVEPGLKAGSYVAGASQVWRFVNEIAVGDYVVSYSPENRTYLIGKVTGESRQMPEWTDIGLPIVRDVNWEANEIDRDSLSVSTRNSLGSTLTVFKVPAAATAEMLGNKPVPAPQQPVDLTDAIEGEVESRDVESEALEKIKDMVSALEPREMEQLVAGVLRAMGYKTLVSPVGADRGKDIIASPDGFGFENPRIVVEVKHRRGPMGSPQLRSFTGGRHRDDRGLYVSTGGFSKEAMYEAERAPMPVTLWTLDTLVRTLIEHYDATDAETKRMVPLKRLYWPA